MELKRPTHSRPRTGEYFDSDDLQRLTGKSPSDFVSVMLKELVDNALDACESAGVHPKIKIELMLEGKTPWLVVSDNGPGIPLSTVKGMLDYDRYVSDKWAFVSPTRGAQGNALKTVIGMPHALGVREPRVVTALGVKHAITTEATPTGDVDIFRQEEAVEEALGTRWEVPFPADIRYLPDLVWWARSYALVNPHCILEINTNIEQAHRNLAENGKIYKPSNPALRKWVPNAPTPAHWYGTEDLRKLIHSYLSNEGDLPIGKFLAQFHGLKSSKKAATVRQTLTGEVDCLSDLKDSEKDVACLLEAMQGHTKPPKHDALGRTGKDHFRECIDRFYGIRKDFKYEHVEGRDENGLPFVFEIATALTKQAGGEHYATNHAAVDSDPFAEKLFRLEKLKGFGISGLSQNAQEMYGDDRFAVVAHLIHPNPSYKDKGKSKVDLKEAHIG